MSYVIQVEKGGAITRVIDPNGFGDAHLTDLTKPFVFLDYVNVEDGNAPGFGFHPHSGIATLTFPLTFDTQHETSTGQVDVVHKQGLEWVVTGKGIWHKAKTIAESNLIQGFQLWLALPPSDELTEPFAKFVQPQDVQDSKPVKVLLGRYKDAVSKIDTPLDINYFWVTLTAGEAWAYQPPMSHQSAWIFVQQGTLLVNNESVSNELVVFSESHNDDGTLNFTAKSDCRFLLGSAAPFPYDLHLGNYSIHTNSEALSIGEENIVKLGKTVTK